MSDKHVLIVDDSTVVRKIMSDIMTNLGFSSQEQAEDGQKALDACERKLPDIVMLDWNMPVMTGIEFLKAFRAKYGMDGTSIIFCTTENDIMKIQEALGEGANEYIMKPFDENVIRDRLNYLGLL